MEDERKKERIKKKKENKGKDWKKDRKEKRNLYSKSLPLFNSYLNPRQGKSATILEATPHEKTAVQPLTSHLKKTFK